MQCNKCGAQLKGDAEFCQICGARVIRFNDIPADSSFSQQQTITGGHAAVAKPPAAKNPFPFAKIITGIVSLALMLVGSIGLMVDFSASANNMVNNQLANSGTALSDEESVSVYVAYLERLQQYSSGIETLENENNKNNISAALIALADIVGDEKEELIFLACETNPGTEKLHIFSYDQGEAKELYADKLPIYAGQGLQPFMLFTLKGDKTLWLYRQTADESEISTYFEFEADSDLYLTKSERYRKTALMEWVKTDGVRVDHRKDQEHCSEEVYNKADEYYHQNIDRAVLVGADLFDEAYRQYVSDYHPKHCYTYAGAVKTLNEHIDSLTGNQTDWQKAYCDFIINEDFRNSPRSTFVEETDILVYLYDLDHDGVPELVITNGSNGRPVTRFAFISTYVGGSVRYLGFGPTDAYFDPSKENSPLIGNVHRGVIDRDHWAAYYKNGDEISVIDQDNDRDFFQNNADYIQIYRERLSDVQANRLSGLVQAYSKYNNAAEASTETVTGVARSPFTLKRIVFGIMALLGLCGSAASMIFIIISKQATVTIITIIIFVTASVGSVGGVTYHAVRCHVFDTASVFDINTAVPSCKGKSVDEAKQELEKMGCLVKTEYQFSDTIPRDTIISQTVKTEADSKTIIVVLIISLGSENQSDNVPGNQTEQTTEKATEKPTEKAPEGYSQKLKVTAKKGSSNARAALYEWQDGKWKELASYHAAVGVNGIGDHNEGQHITPQGIYKLGVVLSKENVGTNLRTYHATSNTCVVDDTGSRYYNQIMEKGSIPAGTHYDNIGNGLTNGTTYATIYIEHNGDGFSPDNVVANKGSAIGVRGQYVELKPNYGDVDISSADMKDLLSRLDANKTPMIEIKTE